MIHQIYSDKKQYLDLLLLGDEQESMIDKYLERGEMFILQEGELKGLCVVTKEEEGLYELKNIAIYPPYQRQGYGRKLMDFICTKYAPHCHTLRACTGDSVLTLPFYQKCGFREVNRVQDFFIHNYDTPIFEAGKQVRDLVCFEKTLKGK